MLLWENIILAINSLRSNKMRALLTMLGIIIGIGSVIAIMTVGNSLQLSVSESMQSMGANDIYAYVNQKDAQEETSEIDGIKYGTTSFNDEALDSDYISNEMINELCDKFSDDIYAINLQYDFGSTTISEKTNSANVNVLGVSVGYFVTNEQNLIDGRMFSTTDFDEGKYVTLVSDKFVDKIFDGDTRKAVGSEIEATIENKTMQYTIVGVYEYEDNNMGMAMMMGDNIATNLYIPLKTAIKLDHGAASYPYLQIVTKVGINSDELAPKIKKFFEPYYRTNRNYEVEVVTMTSMVSMLTDMLSTITLAISVIAGIALVVGGIGVMNIMLVSITERTREIGTRKALGATNSSIRVQFIVEAMIICLIGGIIGVALGITGGILVSKVLGYPSEPSISSIVISLLFSMTVGVFFGYYPANKSAKMNPIDALRYE